MNRRQIIDAFDRIERERGGYAHCDADEVCSAVAAELGLPVEDVRDVMVAHWTMSGAA